MQELAIHMLQDIYIKFMVREKERERKNRANLIFNILYMLAII